MMGSGIIATSFIVAPFLLSYDLYSVSVMNCTVNQCLFKMQKIILSFSNE